MSAVSWARRRRASSASSVAARQQDQHAAEVADDRQQQSAQPFRAAVRATLAPQHPDFLGLDLAFEQSPDCRRHRPECSCRVGRRLRALHAGTRRLTCCGVRRRGVQKCRMQGFCVCSQAIEQREGFRELGRRRYGSTAITNPRGHVLAQPRRLRRTQRQPVGGGGRCGLAHAGEWTSKANAGASSGVCVCQACLSLSCCRRSSPCSAR
jgi:hypothetical protein